MARDFAVSRLTVRHAVGNLVHQGILSRVQGRGTFFLGSGGEQVPTRMIGVIVTYINDYIFPSIIRGLQERLDAEGYAILLFGTGNDPAKEATAVETVLRRQVDGLIIEPTRSMLPSPNLERFRSLVGSGFPLVMVHATYDDLPGVSVEVDDVGGGEAVANHLADLGHRRIGEIIKMDDKQGSRRLQGVLNGLTHQGIPFDAAWCQFFTTETKRVVARRYAERLDETPVAERPSAVICYNDEIAVDLIQYLYALGLRVPEDVSIAGFDDSDLARAVPVGLTTVVHPKVAMGERLAELVLARVHGCSPEAVVFPATLVARGSTIGLKVVHN